MAGNHKVEIIVGVKDMASQAMHNIARAAGSMKNNLNSGNFMGNFSNNIDKAIKDLDRMANSMYKFNMYTADLRRNLTNIGAIGLGATAAVGMQGMNSSIDFDHNTRVMQSRMGVSDQVRQEINDYILKDLNLKVSFGPNELAKTGIILGQGGINNTQDMKSMLKTTTYFAEAVDADVETAAQMIIASAKGFGISMENSSTISDKLTVALNQSLLGANEMPHALGELAGRAKMYGQSLDSSLVALMTGRDQGMSAAQMSQDFLHALRSLSKIGREDLLFPKTRQFYSELGVDTSFFDTEKKQLKEFPEIIESLEKTMMNKGLMKDKDELASILAANGGKLPEDFMNKMESLPLISKVFGAAGMAPIAMGLQSTFEETDPETGEKTGKVYYGSEALKKRRELLQNSDGETERTHETVAESVKFSLEVLKGAWEAAQIEFLDGANPMIKTGADLLTEWMTGVPKEGEEGKDPFDRFRGSVKKSADNFRKDGNEGTATFVEEVGNGIINTAQVSTTFPAIAKKIGGAFMENFVKADWGDSLLTFPWHLVKNSFGFIKDIASANEEFNKLVEQLPQNLQDPAKLVNALAVGGIALVVGGAIVKTLELSFRAASLALKSGKGILNAGQLIKDMVSGGGKDSGGLLDKVFGDNKVIKANIVNVTGGVVNVGDGPDGPGGGKNKKSGGSGVAPVGGGSGNDRTSRSPSNAQTRVERYGSQSTASRAAQGATAAAGNVGKNAGKLGLGVLAGVSVADVISGLFGGPSFIKSTLGSSHKKQEKENDKTHKTVVQRKGIDDIPKQTKLAPVSKGGSGSDVIGPWGKEATKTLNAMAAKANSANESTKKSAESASKAATASNSISKSISDASNKTSSIVAKSSQVSSQAISGQSRVIGQLPGTIQSGLSTGFVPLGASIISGQVQAGQAIQSGIQGFGNGILGGVNNVAGAVSNIKVSNVNNNTVNVPAPVVNVNVKQSVVRLPEQKGPVDSLISNFKSGNYSKTNSHLNSRRLGF